MRSYGLRIIPELRSVHLERLREIAYDEVLYFTLKYDLRHAPENDRLRRVSLLEALILVFKTRATVIEVPELLWLRFLPTNLLLIVCAKLGSVMLRRRREIVYYGIENNTSDLLIGGRVRLVLKPILVSLIRFVDRRLVDRAAYGSPGALATYSSFGVVSSTQRRLFLELPAPAALPAHAEPEPEPEPTEFIFFGELSERKGVNFAMAAFEEFEKQGGGGRLTIAGGGPLSAQVEAWCARSPATRRFEGFRERAVLVEDLRRVDVLIAPSQRSGRWREQIGLPIKEALSHGLLVITTDETGLSEWLKENGHLVVSSQSDVAALSGALKIAAATRVSKRDYVRKLPPVDGRMVADRWLHNGNENADA